MNLEELRTVQHKERQKDSLQHLRPTFYREVGEYIAELEAERDRVAEAADDPFSSPEVGRLTDEIETAKDVVEAIYERRMGKLVKQASLAAAGMPANDEGLSAEEADLFADLVSRIETNKGRVLEVLDGGEAAESPTPTEPHADGRTGEPTGASADAADVAEETPPTPPEAPLEAERDRVAEDERADDRLDAADAMGGDVAADATTDSPVDSPSPAAGSDPSADRPVADDRDPADDPADEPVVDGGTVDGPDVGAPTGDVERLTVRITRDVGSILGVDDREYTLERDDVVTLPEQNAEPLVDRDAAEPLE